MSVESIKAQLAGIFAEARLRRPAAGSRREAKLGRLRGADRRAPDGETFRAVP